MSVVKDLGILRKQECIETLDVLSPNFEDNECGVSVCKDLVTSKGTDAVQLELKRILCTKKGGGRCGKEDVDTAKADLADTDISPSTRSSELSLTALRIRHGAPKESFKRDFNQDTKSHPIKVGNLSKSLTPDSKQNQLPEQQKNESLSNDLVVLKSEKRSAVVRQILSVSLSPQTCDSPRSRKDETSRKSKQLRPSNIENGQSVQSSDASAPTFKDRYHENQHLQNGRPLSQRAPSTKPQHSQRDPFPMKDMHTHNTSFVLDTGKQRIHYYGVGVESPDSTSSIKEANDDRCLTVRHEDAEVKTNLSGPKETSPEGYNLLYQPELAQMYSYTGQKEDNYGVVDVANILKPTSNSNTSLEKDDTKATVEEAGDRIITEARSKPNSYIHTNGKIKGADQIVATLTNPKLHRRRRSQSAVSEKRLKSSMSVPIESSTDRKDKTETRSSKKLINTRKPTTISESIKKANRNQRRYSLSHSTILLTPSSTETHSKAKKTPILRHSGSYVSPIKMQSTLSRYAVTKRQDTIEGSAAHTRRKTPPKKSINESSKPSTASGFDIGSFSKPFQGRNSASSALQIHDAVSKHTPSATTTQNTIRTKSEEHSTGSLRHEKVNQKGKQFSIDSAPVLKRLRSKHTDSSSESSYSGKYGHLKNLQPKISHQDESVSTTKDSGVPLHVDRDHSKRRASVTWEDEMPHKDEERRSSVSSRRNGNPGENVSKEEKKYSVDNVQLQETNVPSVIPKYITSNDRGIQYLPKGIVKGISKQKSSTNISQTDSRLGISHLTRERTSTHLKESSAGVHVNPNLVTSSFKEPVKVGMDRGQPYDERKEQWSDTQEMVGIDSKPMERTMSLGSVDMSTQSGIRLLNLSRSITIAGRRKRREEKVRRRQEREDHKERMEAFRLEKQAWFIDKRAMDIDIRLAKNQRQQMTELKRLREELRTKVITDRLVAAVKRRNIDQIEAALTAFHQRGLEDEDEHGLVTKAKQIIQVVKIKKVLEHAISIRDGAMLSVVLEAIEEKGLHRFMMYERHRARAVLAGIERMRSLLHEVLELDISTVAEIRRYVLPPPAIHTVVCAMLLLLGQHEGITKRWRNCQKFLVSIGQDGLMKRIQGFDVASVHPEVAMRAKEILEEIGLHDVKFVSPAACTLYVWTTGVIEELIYANNDIAISSPATLDRQKEIFRFDKFKKQNEGPKPSVPEHLQYRPTSVIDNYGQY